MESLKDFYHLIINDWQGTIIGGVLMVCAIIFIVGILKKAFLGKIQNTLLRKFVLAFSSIAMSFPTTAIYYLSKGIDFQYYLYGCLVVMVLTVLTYWLYENTCLRDLISSIGEKTVGKWFEVLVESFAQKKTAEETKVELKKATESLESSVHKEVVSSLTKSKDDLSNL